MASSWTAFPHDALFTPVTGAARELLLRLGVRDRKLVADIAALRSGRVDAVLEDILGVAEIGACGLARLTVALEIPTLTDVQSIETCAVAKFAWATSVAITTGHGGRSGEARLVDLILQSVVGDLKIVALGSITVSQQATAMLGVGLEWVETDHCMARHPTQVGLPHSQRR